MTITTRSVPAAMSVYLVGPTGAQAKPLGFQQFTATQLAAAQTLTVPAGAILAVIQAATGAVAWRDDGVAPTASIGMTIAAGNQLQYNGDLSAIQLILGTAGAIANISYYG
jgi:hypothetical protein